jgi:hypothetical protein
MTFTSFSWSKIHKCWIDCRTGAFTKITETEDSMIKELLGGGLTGAELEAWKGAMTRKDDAIYDWAEARNTYNDIARKIKNNKKKGVTQDATLWESALKTALEEKQKAAVNLKASEDYARGLGWRPHYT